jgi:hypothetical protein
MVSRVLDRSSLCLVVGSLVAARALAACGGAAEPPKTQVDDDKALITNIEVAELDINDVQADRFASCSPPGELGQDWIPPIPEWNGASPSDAHADGRAEKVIRSTRAAFRDCYHRGLFADPTQDGRVAVVLRVDPDGHVARAETYGACDLSSEVVACMRDKASSLRFDSSGEAGTVVVPIVMAGLRQRRSAPGPNDSYTAQAYVAIEAARPALHVCAEAARKSGDSVFASAVFGLDVAADGKVVHAHVDNWIGDKDVLTCAAKALGQVRFAPPPAGRGHVMAKLAINPRLGTK